jgi:hypothetical protein
VEQPARDFTFELGSQYGNYTQSQDFASQDDPTSPIFWSQLQQDPCDGLDNYVADTPDQGGPNITFGPGSDQGGPAESLFGEIQEEAPQASQPSQSYMPRFQDVSEEEGRGKRIKRKKVPYTPSSH